MRLVAAFTALFALLVPAADTLAIEKSSSQDRTCKAPDGRTRPPRGVSVKLKLPDRSVSPGEPVRMDLSVRNRSSRRIEYLTGLPRWDYWVKGPGGVVWRWSSTLPGAWISIGIEDELAPGRIKHRHKSWRQEDCTGSPASFPLGRYVARALWNADGQWWSNPVEFEIR